MLQGVPGGRLATNAFWEDPHWSARSVSLRGSHALLKAPNIRAVATPELPRSRSIGVHPRS
eukprot:5847640-Alexandrium_andersonii.AAC.1